MDEPHSCAIFRQQSCSAFVIGCIGTRQAIAGVAAQRTVMTNIVKAPVRDIRIVYRFSTLTTECPFTANRAVIQITRVRQEGCWVDTSGLWTRPISLSDATRFGLAIPCVQGISS